MLMTGSSTRTTDPVASTIPTELVAKIFEHAVLDCWPRSLALSKLRQVCKAWAAFIDATPPLWAAISSREPQRVYPQSLKRSRASPLHVAYLDVDSYHEDPSPEPSFFSTACDHACRWSSFSFTITDITKYELSDMFRRLHTLAIPMVEKLNVDVFLEDYPWSTVEDLFGGTAPRLRYLTLSGVRIPWDSGLLRNLRALDLSYIDVDGPSAHHIAHILANCSTLVELNLQYTSTDYGSVPSDLAPLPLPFMESVHLTLDWPALTHLLKRIRIPNCLRFVCNSEDTQLRTTPVFSTETDHLAPIIRHGISSSTWQDINITVDGIHVAYETRANKGDTQSSLVDIMLWNPIIGMDGQESESSKWTVDNIAMNLANSIPISLTLSHMVLAPFNSNAMNPMMSKLSAKVEELSLALCEPSGISEPLLAYLSEPYKSTEVFHWWFPNLRELTVYYKIGAGLPGQIAQMLLCRKRGGTGRYEFPKRLEKVVIPRPRSAMPPEDVRELEGLVDYVVWSDDESM